MAKRAAQSESSVNLKTRFNEMKRTREEYLDYADQSAAVTMPSLRPKGTNYEATGRTGYGASGVSVPAETGGYPQPLHTQSPHGARALRSLSSVLGKLLMPRGVKYGDFDFPRSVWKQLQAADEQRVQVASSRQRPAPVSIEQVVKERLKQRSTAIVNSLDAKNARPRVRSLIRRQLVEGQCMLVNRPHDIQIFPLRSFVLRRETGKVAEAVLCEKVGGTEYGTEETERYTRILYPNELYPDRQGVWHQIGSQRMGRPSADMKQHQYIVSTGDWPDIDDYVTGYVYENLRQIHRIEHCEASLGEAMGVAAWNVPGMKPGSIPAQNPRVVKERNPGEPLVCQEGDIFWINSGVKITDWAFVGEILKMYREDLDRAFAMRLVDRESTAEATATAVIQMIEELNELTEGLFGALEESLLRPLLWSEFWLQEEMDPIFAGLIEDDTIAEVLPNLLELQVLTGVNAIQRQRALFDMMTVLDRAKQLDETIVVDGVEVADRGADSLMIEKEGLYGRPALPAPGAPSIPGAPGAQSQPTQQPAATAA